MPPAKTRLQISVDVWVASELEERWRASVERANAAGQRVPSFSEWVNEFIRAALLSPALKEWNKDRDRGKEGEKRP